MSTKPHTGDHPRRNSLLATLPGSDFNRLQLALEPVDLRMGQVLCESGCIPAHAYFPTTAVVSLMYLTQDGDSAETAVVGNDGMVGIALLMGGNATPSRAVVQVAGHAYRLPARMVKGEVDRGSLVLPMLLRYVQALIAQTAQTAVCNRHHSIDQQFCRRLLLGLDRSPSDELMMTHERVANLLGVRREGVTAAAQKLQRSGVIRYNRGRIAVLDRKRLEQCSCECYAVAKREHDRLLPAGLANQSGWPLPVTTLAMTVN